MVDPSDWRIASGQERWCRGLVFRWARWAPTPTISYKPDGTTEPAIWDHDHCEFCWREFSTDHDCGDGTRPLTEGYTARGPSGRPDEQRRTTTTGSVRRASRTSRTISGGRSAIDGGHRMGAHALARDAAGGVGGAEEGRCCRRGAGLMRWAVVVVAVVAVLLAVVDMIVTGQMLRGPAVILAAALFALRAVGGRGSRALTARANLGCLSDARSCDPSGCPG